ncbi:putative pentatricopeptide repeat-containing protein [Tripterygium wilfordii]|uniref:Putative pentatricopeptide repeat-containing protein n=1 Tax=Tripterygium wilfordii TaxID=458696 RepID=A0A7J7DWC9_TRIWF|nr:putative pentatricopeptide repeat-containing protein At5g06400, mitochondrial [Tripterygium wilfordii]KAF5750603.1 putative pentatricopeptide repeat-containing protein [Tripterygium wilfordii]
MWKITRAECFCSSSSYNKLIRFLLCRDQTLHLSSLPRSPKLFQSKNTQSSTLTNQPETTTNIAALFKEITEILGSDEIIPDKVSTGISTSKDHDLRAGLKEEELATCTQNVCENAEANIMREKENSSVLEDTQMGNTGEIDVSPMVHEITAIVRAGNSVVSMAERLDKAGFQLDPEIVDKVLKRCFKDPHLAFRFFDWVKMRDGFSHTTKTYNTMLYIAGEAKEFELVEKLMVEMEKSSCEKDIKTYTILMSQYGKAKLISKALMVFEKMRKLGCEPDAEAYRTMIRSLCTAGEAEIAFEFYKEMVHRDMGLDIGSYRLLLNSLVRLGDTAAVHSVAGSMKCVSQIPEHIIFGCMLKSFCTFGKIREALELIRELKNKEIPFDVVYFETLVKGLCRADRIADALEIADIMKRRQLIDGKIYGMIINGYLRKNDIYQALKLFESMKESGYTPSGSTYTELMQQLFTLNEYQKGCELYDEMLERGIKLDSLAITAMVAGHIRQNQVTEAWKVFKSMEDRGIKPTGKSYLIFIQELYKLSRIDEIIKVLDEMKAAKMVIQDQVSRGVMAYLEKRGDKDNAEKVKKMWMMRKLHFQEEEKSAIAFGVEETHMVVRHDQSESAEADCHPVDQFPKRDNQQDLLEICKILSSSIDWSFIQEALEKHPIAYTPELVVEILKSCSMHGNAVLRFFSWVGTQAGYRHTAETYNMAIKISGRGKDFKHMRGLFFEMRRKGCSITPDTWTIMIMQYGRIGLTEIALRIFNEMKADGCNPNGSTYKSLLISLCGRKGRKVDEAIKIFQEMIRAECVPDKELLETYLDCLCFSDKLLEAKRSVESICKIGFTVPLSHSMLIRALCRAGRLEEALALLDEVGTGAERFTLDQYVFASLVHGLLSKGRLKEALEKVDSMKQMGIYPTVHVYTSLMDHFFKEKQIEDALEMFKKMQQEGCVPTIVTYCAMIRGLVNAGQVADAWDIFNRVKVKGPQPGFKTYSIFITCLCRAGRSEDALQLLSEMQNNGIVPSTVNFRAVFYGLNREGKQNIAQTVLKQKSALKYKRKYLT